MSVEICVQLEESWGWGAELNIHESKIKYQADKLLSFAS